eukprot:3147493-Rhodomonas_salina.3
MPCTDAQARNMSYAHRRLWAMHTSLYTILAARSVNRVSRTLILVAPYHSQYQASYRTAHTAPHRSVSTRQAMVLVLLVLLFYSQTTASLPGKLDDASCFATVSQHTPVAEKEGSGFSSYHARREETVIVAATAPRVTIEIQNLTLNSCAPTTDRRERSGTSHSHRLLNHRPPTTDHRQHPMPALTLAGYEGRLPCKPPPVSTLCHVSAGHAVGRWYQVSVADLGIGGDGGVGEDASLVACYAHADTRCPRQYWARGRVVVAIWIGEARAYETVKVVAIRIEEARVWGDMDRAYETEKAVWIEEARAYEAVEHAAKDGAEVEDVDLAVDVGPREHVRAQQPRQRDHRHRPWYHTRAQDVSTASREGSTESWAVVQVRSVLGAESAAQCGTGRG